MYDANNRKNWLKGKEMTDLRKGRKGVKINLFEVKNCMRLCWSGCLGRKQWDLEIKSSPTGGSGWREAERW